MVARKLAEVTSAKAVEQAIDEADKLGREAFRLKYGFGKSRTYYLRHDGKTYDSKPIIAVAFGYQHTTKPLAFNEFSGGAATVKPVLEALGFTVVVSDLGDEAPPYFSEWLDVGEVYTRENLRELFGIGDATINNGVFRPKGSKSIWLFVTKEKTADRPQLSDDLTGDVLLWDGQPAGRTDAMLIEHLANGEEVLLFYRERRSQFAHGGFRYEGPFLYRSHSGTRPTKFVFDRDGASASNEPRAAHDGFDPTNVADGRSQTLALVRLRQGQPKFRRELIEAYSGRCALTGCDFLPLLEAAHIHPYRGKETNHVSNGLLLRADVHTLFDLGLLAVKPDGSLDICSSLSGTEYTALKVLMMPKIAANRPSADALAWHRERIANPEVRDRLIAKVKQKG